MQWSIGLWIGVDAFELPQGNPVPASICVEVLGDCSGLSTDPDDQAASLGLEVKHPDWPTTQAGPYDRDKYDAYTWHQDPSCNCTSIEVFEEPATFFDPTLTVEWSGSLDRCTPGTYHLTPTLFNADMLWTPRGGFECTAYNSSGMCTQVRECNAPTDYVPFSTIDAPVPLAPVEITVAEWETNYDCRQIDPTFQEMAGSAMGVIATQRKWIEYEIACPQLSVVGRSDLGERVMGRVVNTTVTYAVSPPQTLDPESIDDTIVDTTLGQLLGLHSEYQHVPGAPGWAAACSADKEGWPDGHQLDAWLPHQVLELTTNDEFPITMTRAKTGT